MGGGGRRTGLGVLAVASGAVWYVSLMQPVLSAARFGPICHHGGSLALHCPACVAALALVAGGLAALATPTVRRVRALRA